MKCPKCGYVGFESSEKCKNCGYHFSLAEPAADLELPLDQDDPLALDVDTLVAAAQVELAATPAPTLPKIQEPERIRRTEPRISRTDLPLFSGDTTASRVEAPSPRLRPRNPDTDAQPVRTPVNVAVDIQPAVESQVARDEAPGDTAGPTARVVAFLLDLLILGGLNGGVLYFTLSVLRLSWSEVTVLPAAPLLAFFVMIDGAYFVAFVANGGQTIGKMAASIRVTGENGEDVGSSQAFLRTCCYVASAIPAGLGFVWGLFPPTRRALHDRLASTRVVRV